MPEHPPTERQDSHNDPARARARSGYREIVETLARPRRTQLPDLADRVSYAFTPFAIIGQTWREQYGPFAPHPVDTTIALFYTFDTFIQECLAIDARRAGAAAADIIGAYQHRHAHVRMYPNLLLRDPALLPLARYANPAIDWSQIGATPENVDGSALPGWRARSSRDLLFSSRLRTHLMVAIATALHGVATFENGHARSSLVRTAAAPPDIDALAPHWLRHVLGDYDHAAECAGLLESLALHYGQDLTSDHIRGMPIPPYRAPRDQGEWDIVAAAASIWRDCTLADPIDPFRWNLFGATLDDAAVTRWSEEAMRWVREWPLRPSPADAAERG